MYNKFLNIKFLFWTPPQKSLFVLILLKLFPFKTKKSRLVLNNKLK